MTDKLHRPADMINPDQANMRGKLGFFFGGLAALCLVWSYFRVPEL